MTPLYRMTDQGFQSMRTLIPDLWAKVASVSTIVSVLRFTLGTIVCLGFPKIALALTVSIVPSQPSQGDTIVVRVETTDPAPVLQWRNQSYPLFAVGNQRFRALLPTTPLDTPGASTLTVQAEGQGRQFKISLSDRDFPTQSIWLPPGDDDLGTDLEFDRVDAFKRLVTAQKRWSGAFLRPTDGEVTTVYGVQRYYNGDFAEDYYHRGVDYGAATGTPVVAPAAGRVALVGREAEGFELHGNTVGLDHGQGVLSIFLHLSQINVQEGQVLTAGQVLGRVGSTGIATGPHLHWGLYVQGKAVDPVPWRFEGIE